MTIILSLLATITISTLATPQTSSATRFDPLGQKIGSFVLTEETLGDALGKINRSFDVSISIEGVLSEAGTVKNPKFTATIENRTLAEVLDWLCALDTRYSWMRDGNNVNLFPRSSSNDSNYFFNRAVTNLRFENVRSVADAVIVIDRQSSDPDG